MCIYEGEFHVTYMNVAYFQLDRCTPGDAGEPADSRGRHILPDLRQPDRGTSGAISHIFITGSQHNHIFWRIRRFQSQRFIF